MASQGGCFQQDRGVSHRILEACPQFQSHRLLNVVLRNLAWSNTHREEYVTHANNVAH